MNKYVRNHGLCFVGVLQHVCALSFFFFLSEWVSASLCVCVCVCTCEAVQPPVSLFLSEEKVKAAERIN